jgi:hypothetical protein
MILLKLVHSLDVAVCGANLQKSSPEVSGWWIFSPHSSFTLAPDSIRCFSVKKHSPEHCLALLLYHKDFIGIWPFPWFVDKAENYCLEASRLTLKLVLDLWMGTQYVTGNDRISVKVELQFGNGHHHWFLLVPSQRMPMKFATCRWASE